jgi:hypothetical protein
MVAALLCTQQLHRFESTQQMHIQAAFSRIDTAEAASKYARLTQCTPCAESSTVYVTKAGAVPTGLPPQPYSHTLQPKPARDCARERSASKRYVYESCPDNTHLTALNVCRVFYGLRGRAKTGAVPTRLPQANRTVTLCNPPTSDCVSERPHCSASE